MKRGSQRVERPDQHATNEQEFSFDPHDGVLAF